MSAVETSFFASSSGHFSEEAHDDFLDMVEANFICNLRQGRFASVSTASVIVASPSVQALAQARHVVPYNVFDAHKLQLEQRQEQEIADSVLSSWGEVLNHGAAGGDRARPPWAGEVAGATESNGGVSDESREEEVELDTATFLNMSSAENDGGGDDDEHELEGEQQQSRERAPPPAAAAEATVPPETAATTAMEPNWESRNARGDIAACDHELHRERRREGNMRHRDDGVGDVAAIRGANLQEQEHTRGLPSGGSRMLPLSVIAPPPVQNVPTHDTTDVAPPDAS